MEPMKTDRYDLADQLRRAVRAAGLTTYTLAVKAHIDRAVTSRFLRGNVGLNLTSASRVCRVLGLTLQPAARLARKKA
jgi:hypothetical protein